MYPLCALFKEKVSKSSSCCSLPQRRRSSIMIFFDDRIGEPHVWDFFRAEWDYLVDRFTLNDRYFGKFVATLSAR